MRSGRNGQVAQPEFVRRGLSGEKPPQIDGELTGDGHDHFLARRRTAPGIAQHRHSLLQSVAVRVPAHHSPDHLHEHDSDSWISVLAHAASSSLAPATGFPREETAVAEYLSPIGNP